MKCPACARDTPDESRFCPWCGRPLQPSPDLTVMGGDLDMTVASLVPVLPRTGTADRTPGIPATELGPRPEGQALRFDPGTMLAGRYRIIRELGRGGMGIVYQADDIRLGHVVALKFLPPALAGDDRRLAQFHNEVAVARQISHPNVCRVYDIGDVDGCLFLSMEYVEGEDLGAVLKRQGGFSEREAIELIRQICGGLAAVHDRGVLHRDLKPANIMIDGTGHARLMDFGIAGASTGESARRITEGTPAYMAPEQFQAAGATVRSDIYALGLVMYEILRGERLLVGGTTRELMQQQQSAAAAITVALDGKVSAQLQATVLRCLDPDPASRPASAQEVASTLQTVLLDARTKGRRLLQVMAQFSLVPVAIFAVAAMLRPSGASGTTAVVLLAVCAALVAVELWLPLGWTVVYKGHEISFRNHPVFGERLYIDGVLTDRGRIGFNITLRGTLEKGAGAGERITAHVQTHFSQIACRIVAESFAPAAVSASGRV